MQRQEGDWILKESDAKTRRESEAEIFRQKREGAGIDEDLTSFQQRDSRDENLTVMAVTEP